MIVGAELEHVRRHSWLWDHCWRYFSLIGGEPFLYQECLVHFDGHHLYCNTFPLNSVDKIEPSAVLNALVDRFKPALVWHSGPLPGPHTALSSTLLLVHESDPSSDDVCMSIDLSHFHLRDNSRRAEWIRAGERRGLYWSAQQAAVMSVAHLLLMEELVARVVPGPVARTLMSRLPDFARQTEAYLVNVFLAGKLVGFCVVEGWASKMDVALFSFGNRTVPGVKDFLQWAVIEHALSRGKQEVNVGYSISKGIKSFKQKWGAVPITGGYYDQLWHAYPDFDPVLCHWPNRLLFLGP
jgi:hypothetical protein